MNETLQIKNFGPLIDIDLQLERTTVFIGTQGSGKSCISKLLSIFRSSDNFTSKIDLENLLTKYNINSFLKKETVIRYSTNHCEITVKNKRITFKQLNTEEVNKFSEKNALVQALFEEYRNVKDKLENDATPSGLLTTLTKEIIDEYGLLHILKNSLTKDPIYIPSERIFISTISESLFGLSNNKIALPQCIIDFGTLFENHRKTTPNLNIDFLNIKYANKNNSDKIILDKKTEIKLSESSSGIQALVPMLVILDGTCKFSNNSTFVIEEPEINLYPLNQKKLIQFIIDKCISKKDNDLIITTHSPYVLNSLNLGILAHRVGSIESKKNAVINVIPEIYWINPSEITAYYLDDGKCKNIYDKNTGYIAITDLDDVSNLIDADKDKLNAINRGEI